jgi:hypothetical protein
MITAPETRTKLPEVAYCDWCHTKAESQLAQALSDYRVRNKPTLQRLYKTNHLLHLESRRVKLLNDPENVPAEYLYLSEPAEKITPVMIAGEIEALLGMEDATFTHDIFAIAIAYQTAMNRDYVATRLDYEMFTVKRWALLPQLIEENDFYPEARQGGATDSNHDDTAITLF